MAYHHRYGLHTLAYWSSLIWRVTQGEYVALDAHSSIDNGAMSAMHKGGWGSSNEAAEKKDYAQATVGGQIASLVLEIPLVEMELFGGIAGEMMVLKHEEEDWDFPRTQIKRIMWKVVIVT
ncbi:hypothetical protein Tco_0761689, partial [Tanacetum coccineum]